MTTIPTAGGGGPAAAATTGTGPAARLTTGAAGGLRAPESESVPLSCSLRQTLRRREGNKCLICADLVDECTGGEEAGAARTTGEEESDYLKYVKKPSEQC